jgi:hypothetical protein
MKYSKTYYDNLLFCCEFGQEDKVLSYIKKGLDINYKNRDGVSALSTAITYNKVDIVKLLLNHNVIIPEKAQYTSRKKESFLAVVFHSNSQIPMLNLLYQYQPNSMALKDENLFPLIQSVFTKNQEKLFQTSFSHLKDKNKYLTKVVELIEINYHHYYPNYVDKVMNLTNVLLDVVIEHNMDIEKNNVYHRLHTLAQKHNPLIVIKLEQLYLSKNVSSSVVAKSTFKI